MPTAKVNNELRELMISLPVCETRSLKVKV
jgi:hypothetical protein